MSTVTAAYTSNIAKLTALVYQLDSVDALCKEENTLRVVLRRCLGYTLYEHCTCFTSIPSTLFSISCYGRLSATVWQVPGIW